MLVQMSTSPVLVLSERRNLARRCPTKTKQVRMLLWRFLLRRYVVCYLVLGMLLGEMLHIAHCSTQRHVMQVQGAPTLQLAMWPRQLHTLDMAEARRLQVSVARASWACE